MTTTQLGFISQLRIIVPAGGFFEITQKEWEEYGLTIHNLDHLNLEFKGKSYPFWVNQEPDMHTVSIRFYSPKNGSGINLKENIFILSNKQSDHSDLITPLILSPIQGNSGLSTTGIFRETYQNQSIYLPQVAGEDQWLWSLLQPNQIVEQEIQLSELPVDRVTIRSQFWITPTSSWISSQLLTATINEHNLETLQIQGQDWQKIEIQIDASYLSKMNIYTIQPVTATGNLPGKIYLDSIEIEYANPISLGSRIQSFMVLDDKPLNTMVSSPGTLVILDTTEKPLDIYSVQSNGQINIVNYPGAKYHWIPNDQYLPVLTIQSLTDELLINPSKSINYLVIAPEIFQPELLPLIDLRNEQGFNTMVVSPQQIYDTYNSGYPSIDSLKEFVQSIYEIELGQLEYLLLVGDFSYEIADYQQFVNYVPSFFVNSGQMGQTISDFPYADLNGDSQPDLAVGRVPGESPQQVTAWVDKVINYEASISSKWNKVIGISDKADPAFLETAQNFLKPFSDEYQTQIFNSPDSDEIQKMFAVPYSLLVYFGHGSVDLWGKDKILSTTMIADLPESSAPPVSISISCLNGYFIHPDKLSLAEALLFHPGGGATGILAPTGQSTLENQEKLAYFFQNKLQLNNYSRINELIFPQNGDEFLGVDGFLVETMKTYLYFGDPAMLIQSANN